MPQARKMLVLAVVTLAASVGLADEPSSRQLQARNALAPFRAVTKPQLTMGLMVRRPDGDSAAVLPDFGVYENISTRKVRFFAYLMPLVEAENQRVAEIRRRLEFIDEQVRWHHPLNAEDQAWLAKLTTDYRLPESDPGQADFWVAAFERVDSLPVDLVLVQAANESAWGMSRFAREGNNLFGQWCFREGCGIVPRDRPAGARYEVARFGSVRESIGSYVHNLNTGSSYQLLREIRARMRHEGQPLDPAELAAGLVDYSERGLAYVSELRAMIRHNAAIIASLRADEKTRGSS